MSCEPPVVPALRDFASAFVADEPVLRQFRDEAVLLLHGSTTLGFTDVHADLDVWLLLPDDRIADFDALSPTRFIPFALGGRPGHFSVASAEQLARRVYRCDLPLIYELRHASVLRDAEDTGRKLQAVARRAMRDEVRRALMTHHYVEFRSDHRAADTPIERGEAHAVLQAVTLAVGHALRCAMVTDGEPYPYIKWLHRAARVTPTGAPIAALVDELIALLGAGHLRTAGPEKQHPLSLKLRQIREVLVNRCDQSGLGGPWLRDWWLHIDPTRAAVAALRW